MQIIHPHAYSVGVGVYKILITILKNIFSFLAGAILGVLIELFFVRSLLVSTLTKDVGLGVIALVPVVVIIYSVLFGGLGGSLGIIIYNVIRYFKRKNSS